MNDVQDLKNVSLAVTYEIDDSFDSDKFIKMRLRVCHDGKNPNGSSFEVENMERAKDSIMNIPILANVIFDENNTPQFGGHDVEIEEDKVNEGEYKLIYKETPIGVVPETNNHEIAEYNGKNYVFVDSFVWKEYSNYAQNIIERDKNIKLSMEITVDNYSYNSKEKCYNIIDYRYLGITFLNKDFGTGMVDALATTDTFEQNNKEKLFVMMSELKTTLENYNSLEERRSQENMDEEKDTFEEVETTEDVKIDEAEEIENTEEAIEAESKDEAEEFSEETKSTEEEKKNYMKIFEISHDDIRSALYALLAPVEEEDEDWYWISNVYDAYFEYEGYFNSVNYRQSYSVDGDNVLFSGERIKLYKEMLTQEEKDVLDEMRSSYSRFEELKEFEVKIKTEQRNEAESEIFSKFDKQLTGVEEYETLKTNSKEYDLETLSDKCFSILGKKTANFSIQKPKDNSMVKLPIENEIKPETAPYGGLFEQYKVN